MSTHIFMVNLIQGVLLGLTLLLFIGVLMSSRKDYIDWVFIFIFGLLICFQVSDLVKRNKTIPETDNHLWNYKAELKSGEIVDASMCITVDDKATCLIKKYGAVDYVVVSYELITNSEDK